MGSSFTRDDGMVGAMYLHVQTEQAFGLAPSLPLQSVDEWRPMVSLRHMAQQIMIRNMAETPRGTPRTTHHLELHRASLSSSSSDSSLPGTPLWMDEEMHRDFSLVGDSLFRKRPAPAASAPPPSTAHASQSNVTLTRASRQPSFSASRPYPAPSAQNQKQPRWWPHPCGSWWTPRCACSGGQRRSREVHP
ncbi:hypothetical protein DSO57_1039486 [Entomophthora muscae]|uniref:Uncharacterized protein n=1 Tax=Entomophthora muscae TaxID=34485 RepID=A0ACC2SYF6_9FUNG|nr:hypothetical protein DSO57_1039486 [Entomophthora muscae]